MSGDALLGKLNAVLRFALDSKLSSFYRAKYGASAPAAFASLDDFARLPFLEKRELLAAPWRERLFVPEAEVADFGVTSGTTGSGRPLIVPRTDALHEDMLRATAPRGLLKSLGVARLMTLMPPMSGITRKVTALPLPGVFVFTGDVRNPGASALVAKELGVDGLITTPTGFERFAEAAGAAGFDLRGLKWVSLGGEAASAAKHAYLRAQAPNAVFSARFGAAEFGPTRFERCESLRDEPSLFHPVPGAHHLEVVRPDGSPSPAGEDGELVTTDLRVPSAFPFLRYKTGDAVAWLGRPCACGAAATLRVRGRLGYDSVRCAGVVLSVEMIERALERHRDAVGTDFRLDVRETELRGKPVPRLELRVVPIRDPGSEPLRRGLAARLEKDLPADLALSPGLTLADLIRAGAFAPLAVELASGFPAEAKPRRIVSHL